MPASLPAQVPQSVGVRVYSVIERIAPASYVESMLARVALDRGELAKARLHALRLRPQAEREELLGTIAQARGNQRVAIAHFIVATDIFAVTAKVERLARHDPAAAYALELRLKARLEQLRTHPDAQADASWRLGRLATELSARGLRAEWLRISMGDYARAVELAPLSEKYLMAAGVQALNLNDPADALVYFRRAVDVNPVSADGYAGLGVATLRRGDRAGARRYAAQSRRYNPGSTFLRDLEADLR